MAGTAQVAESLVVTVVDQGSVCAFVAGSEAARVALADLVDTEPWQWLGSLTLVVDHRFAAGLVDLLRDDGVEVHCG